MRYWGDPASQVPGVQLEPPNNLLRVHPRFNDLKGHPSADRLFLLSHVDNTKSTFADLLEESISADLVAWLMWQTAIVRNVQHRGT